MTFIALMIVRIPLAFELGRNSGFNAMRWSFPIRYAIAALLNAVYQRFAVLSAPPDIGEDGILRLPDR